MLKRIGPLAAIIITVFYLLALYLFAISNTPENLSASVYSESLIETAYQYLLLLVGFDTLIYRKYYDTPPILVDHQQPLSRTLGGGVGALSFPRQCSLGDTSMVLPGGELYKPVLIPTGPS